ISFNRKRGMSQIVIFKRSGKSRDNQSHTAKWKAHGATHIALPLVTARRFLFRFKRFPSRATPAGGGAALLCERKCGIAAISALQLPIDFRIRIFRRIGDRHVAHAFTRAFSSR
ncbi:MAG: hypothetical protein V4801_40160, partial [Burkholderia gladioli]